MDQRLKALLLVEESGRGAPYIFVLCMERLGHSIFDTISNGRWDPIYLVKNGTKVSHLFFADDLLLFYKVDVQNAMTVKSVLDDYSFYSGHRVSISKTQIYFSPNMDPSKVKEVETTLGYRRVTNLGTYLGFPLIHGRGNAADFHIDKFSGKFSGWNARLLDMVRRIILAKAILGAIAVFWMQIVLLPTSTRKIIEHLVRHFIWGGTKNQNTMSIISWKEICQPCRYDDLGIRCLSETNVALVMKIGYQLVEKHNALWVTILKAKHKMFVGCLESIKCQNVSIIWRSVSKVWGHIYDGLGWSLGDGKSTKFWTDQWCSITVSLLSHVFDVSEIDVEATAHDMVILDGKGIGLF